MHQSLKYTLHAVILVLQYKCRKLEFAEQRKMAIYTQCGSSPQRNNIPDSTKTMGPSVFFFLLLTQSQSPSTAGDSSPLLGPPLQGLGSTPAPGSRAGLLEKPTERNGRPLTRSASLLSGQRPWSTISHPNPPNAPPSPFLSHVQLLYRETFPLVFLSFILNTLECTSASYFKGPGYFCSGQQECFDPKNVMFKVTLQYGSVGVEESVL